MRDKGFTLIEMLVTVAMVGVLSAIAVPSWLGFLQQRRLSASTDYVLQSIRAAQMQAKLEKSSKSPASVASKIHPTVTVVHPSPMLVFDHRGTVPKKDNAGNNIGVPYRVNLTVTNSSKVKCVVVRTVLGATATGKDAAECDLLDDPD